MSSTYAHIDQVTLKKVCSLLIVTKSRLNRHHLLVYAPLVEVIVVQRQPLLSSNRGQNGFHDRGHHNSSQGSVSSCNRSDTYPTSIIICQMCGKPSHLAHKCYHHFDLTYQDSSCSHNKQALITSNNRSWENEWHKDISATHHITHEDYQINLSYQNWVLSPDNNFSVCYSA